MTALAPSAIDHAGLVHLAGLTALKTLTLYDTQVTDVGVAELQQALPNCAISLAPPTPFRPF